MQAQSSNILHITADCPEKLEFLHHHHRYKVLYGGRGGAKSWAISRWLLIEGAIRPLRILCTRETQRSIKESVHRLLCDQIELLGIGHLYRIEAARLTGLNGTEFFFAGLRHDPGALKSYEGVDICWVEEAQTVSHSSWAILIPTIRKAGSEIVLSLNPDLASDDTYQRFIVHPPPDAKVCKVTYRDNPWFPDVLRKEAEHLKEVDPDAYNHIWEGCCLSVLEGAVYANELRQADAENRITRVPYDPTRAVHTFWDLGWGDATAIWFVQVYPFEYRLIDYLEGVQHDIGWYLREMQTRPYLYGTCYLPHDARAKSLGTGKSVEELIRAAGRQVRIVPQMSIDQGINAARTIFPQCWFDSERCADGIQHLRHYRYGKIEELGNVNRKEPLHDEASHACLTGDSMVLTRDGPVRIDSILPGEMVWTPAGYAQVTAAGPVKEVSELVEIRMGNGAVLRCTPEHKIFTSRGLVRADALRYSDRVFRGNEWNIRLASLFSRAANIGFRETITGVTSGQSRVLPTFIERFGSLFTGLSRTVSMCTMSMETVLTTTFPIYSWCAGDSIGGSTRWSVYARGSCIPLTNSPEHGLPSGIDPKPDTAGILNTEKMAGKTGNGLRSVACNVASFFARLGLRAPSTATRIAKLSLFAPDTDSRQVYDLTVSKHACYQANGVLVSNSDALRYFAVGVKPQDISKPPAYDYHRPSGAYGWMG